jgi:hypothetical protein
MSFLLYLRRALVDFRSFVGGLELFSLMSGSLLFSMTGLTSTALALCDVNIFNAVRMAPWTMRLFLSPPLVRISARANSDVVALIPGLMFFGCDLNEVTGIYAARYGAQMMKLISGGDGFLKVLEKHSMYALPRLAARVAVTIQSPEENPASTFGDLHDLFKQTGNQRTPARASHVAILTARSSKRNGPLVLQYAGGNA